MFLFTPEPVSDGFGFYHINRFRICMKPSGPAALEGLRKGLLQAMVRYMDPDTATVTMDDGHPWEGRPTLMFYGIPVIRPFDGPIAPNLLPPGLREVSRLIPPGLRGFKMPAIHTDSVGILPGSVTSSGFTVQTLKRNFETNEDRTIRDVLSTAINVAIAAEAVISPILAYDTYKRKQQLIDYAIWVNQHHFLAGRRSFRFFAGKDLGYTDDRIVFETAAVERYAKLAFAAPTEGLMGGDKKSLEVVWIEMVSRVAAGQPVLAPLTNHPTLAREANWQQAGKGGNVLEYYDQCWSAGSVVSSAGSLLRDPGLHPLLYQP